MELLGPGPAGLRRAADLLAVGGVIAFPTDTVYGLAALPSRPEALERIFELKQRPRDRPLVLMAASAGEIDRWAEVTGAARALMARWWPGPLTLVLPARRDLPAPLAAGDPPSIGVRVPDHPLAQGLLGMVGGTLGTTSANLSGAPAAMTAGEAEAIHGLTAVIDGGRAPGGIPSTVLDLTGPAPRVLREGAIARHLLGG